MSSNRSSVTYCGRAKLLSLIAEKFGVFFVSQPHGSLEMHIKSDMQSGEWVQLETVPRVYVDSLTFQKIQLENAIDFDFNTHEFIIRQEAVAV